ncbi:MAG: NERD domain-containing protein [Kiritimatiellae bacterium]|nr:NERD domain-containing protein [Kiritimatiellia bacterium]MBQ9344702.1 NERD domain-containing protein [Kiritimatiellia bacterium]
MAKILRSETSLGRRQRELEEELRRSPTASVVVWAIIAVCALALLLPPLGTALRTGVWTGPAAANWLGRLAAVALLVALGIGYRWRLREIAEEAHNLEGGERGERRLADRLAEQLADNHLILNDLDLRIAHERFQIDHLVIAPSGVYVLESKYWTGTLSGDIHDHSWTQTAGSHPPRTVKSPVIQVLRQRRMFISLFPGGPADDHVHAYAVFTHPRVALKLTANDPPVALRIQDAIRLINDHCFDPPVWSDEQMQAFARRILDSQK